MMPDLIGKTIGKYQIIEQLGQGGMASVYKAYQANLDRHVALKVLNPTMVEVEDFVIRFRREATAIARLRHPNIVQLHDFDVENKLYYMVIEFIEGMTLKAEMRHRAQTNQGFALPEIAQIFANLASAVNYAHQQGMIHRDLKPANVILNQQGQAILTDFGIARLLDAAQMTITGTMFGTPNYMSPEQGEGRRGNEQSDIYSLGIILYELLVGQVPFDADTPVAVVMQHINASPPAPTLIVPTIPSAVEQVVLKSLSKAPADRYQTASEMAAALQAAITTVKQAPEAQLPEADVIIPAAAPVTTPVEPTSERADLPKQPGPADSVEATNESAQEPSQTKQALVEDAIDSSAVFEVSKELASPNEAELSAVQVGQETPEETEAAASSETPSLDVEENPAAWEPTLPPPPNYQPPQPRYEGPSPSPTEPVPQSRLPFFIFGGVLILILCIAGYVFVIVRLFGDEDATPTTAPVAEMPAETFTVTPQPLEPSATSTAIPPTNTATPTATPTLLPTSTPTEAPLPTPTAVLLENCVIKPDSGFMALWLIHSQALGCPTEPKVIIPLIAEEAFEGGHMFWRSDLDRVYLIQDRRRRDGAPLFEGIWELVPEDRKWDGSNPDGVGLTPPLGLVEPKRGFGWLWRNFLNRENGNFGWALDREYGFENLAQAQSFERGLVFRGSDPKTYVLLFDNRFFAQR